MGTTGWIINAPLGGITFGPDGSGSLAGAAGSWNANVSAAGTFAALAGAGRLTGGIGAGWKLVVSGILAGVVGAGWKLVVCLSGTSFATAAGSMLVREAAKVAGKVGATTDSVPDLLSRDGLAATRGGPTSSPTGWIGPLGPSAALGGRTVC